MRINLFTLSASSHGVFHPGEVDVPDELAVILLYAGVATPVGKVIEQAVVTQSVEIPEKKPTKRKGAK